MKNKIIIFLIFSFSLNLALYGQLGSGNGRIHGTVSDKSGNPLAGVKVQVKNLRYSTTLESFSNEKGHWSVTGLASGPYFITVFLDGYRKEQIHITLSFALKRVHIMDIELTKIQKPSSSRKGQEGSKAKALTKFLNEGNDLYEQGLYEEATVKFEEYLVLYPGVYQVQINIGNCYRQRKEYDKAIAAYSIFLEKVQEEKGSLKGDEDAARVLATIGEVFLIQNNEDKAMDCFKQAVDNYPEDEILAYNVGVISFNQGQPELAIEYLNIAIRIKESWPPPYSKIGYAYLNRGKYKLAIDSFKKFIELAPEDPQVPTIQNLIPQLEEFAKKQK